jgi:hypothetical protein
MIIVSLIIYAHFHFVSSLSSIVVPCIWTPLNVTNYNNNFSNLSHVSYGHCDRQNNIAQRIRVRIVLKEKILQIGNQSSYNNALIIRDKWNYLRLYAAFADADCKKDDYPKWKCFVSGTVDLKIISSDTFEMELMLPTGHKYSLYLIRGMEECDGPIDKLNESDWPGCDLPENNNTSICTRLYCKYIEFGVTNPPPTPIVQFNLSVTTNPINNQTIINETKTICRLHNQHGAWMSLSKYISPYSCISKEYTPSLCVIGDSHMVRSNSHKYLGSARFIPNYVFNEDISKPLKGQLWHPHTASMLNSIDECHEHRLVTIWWYGSHSYHLSTDQLTQTIYTFGKHYKAIKSNTCVIIVGILDSTHEHIPMTFSFYRHFLQNSWRIKSQNNALKTAVVNLNISTVHYVDIFDQSLAYHYDFHHDVDPVHFPTTFYQYFGHFIRQAVNIKCAHK